MPQCFSPWNWLLMGLMLLPACSSYEATDRLAGLSRDEVVARMGQPDRERQVEAGTRLEFPRGPYGKNTWFIYFDASGRATRAEQVLTEQNFMRINPGMPQEDVIRLLGRPNEVQLLGRERGTVWNYRYESPFCRWFQVELSLQQEVRLAGYGEPPECTEREFKMRLHDPN
ncbi:MAG: hypothetical protein ACYC4S_14120 [Rhodoferax sp.]